MAPSPTYESGPTDTYAFVVDYDGTCVVHPRLPTVVGQKPWDWCLTEHRSDCRERFVRACMLRERVERFETLMRLDGQPLRVSMTLFPLESSRGVDAGQVLSTYHHIYEPKLTDRERGVLALLSSGVSTTQIAATLCLSASTVRDYVARLKKKLHTRTIDGLVAAGNEYGVNGNGTTTPFGRSQKRGRGVLPQRIRPSTRADG